MTVKICRTDPQHPKGAEAEETCTPPAGSVNVPTLSLFKIFPRNRYMYQLRLEILMAFTSFTATFLLSYRISGGMEVALCTFSHASQSRLWTGKKCNLILMRYLLGVTDKEREIRRDDILSTRLKDFKEFVDFLEIVKDKGVVVAVASPDDVPATNKERSDFFEVKSIIGC
ncbi:hypothetical protein Leryth_001164 [Lithospermum erythrorhizon]|nr:hypothetical protein Leryth_001164 [Lithospermum erythrorhizon]